MFQAPNIVVFLLLLHHQYMRALITPESEAILCNYIYLGRAANFKSSPLKFFSI